MIFSSMFVVSGHVETASHWFVPSDSRVRVKFWSVTIDLSHNNIFKVVCVKIPQFMSKCQLYKRHKMPSVDYLFILLASHIWKYHMNP